jgi:putative transposase
MKNNQLLPYWSNSVDGLSKDLWIPHKSLLSNIDSINSNASWFSFQSWNNPNYSNKFTLNSLPQLNNNPIIKAKKIRIYPNAQQKNLFRQWLGTSRKVYNDTVNHLNLPKEVREKHWMGAAKIILTQFT